LPGELDDMRDGYEWRRERDQRDLAVLCATIMNSSGRYYKRPVRPADLLKKPKAKKVDKRSAAARAAELRELEESFKHGN
jgi:hypothetical protein